MNSKKQWLHGLLVLVIAASAAMLSVQGALVFADDYSSVSKNWNISAPGANTDAITDIVWGSTPDSRGSETCRVSVQVATSSVVNVMVSRGGTEKALGMNSNSALVAGALYTWDVSGMKVGDIVNIQVETDSVLDKADVGALRPVR